MTDNLQDNNNETPNAENSQNDATEKVERYKQQIEGSKKEAERLRNLALESEVKRAEVDANSIIELHGKDPKLADEVAKRFWYGDFGEAKASIEWSGSEESFSDTRSDREKFEEWYKEKRGIWRDIKSSKRS